MTSSIVVKKAEEGKEVVTPNGYFHLCATLFREVLDILPRKLSPRQGVAVCGIGKGGIPVAMYMFEHLELYCKANEIPLHFAYLIPNRQTRTDAEHCDQEKELKFSLLHYGHIKNDLLIICDDIYDSGFTYQKICEQFPDYSKLGAFLFSRREFGKEENLLSVAVNHKWIVFPTERAPESEDGIEIHYSASTTEVKL